MDTSREDVGISIRSAFLRKGTQQRFSLFVLTIISILLIFLETIETKPLNRIRSFIKDAIYRGSTIVSLPSKGISFNFGLIGTLISTVKENIILLTLVVTVIGVTGIIASF